MMSERGGSIPQQRPGFPRRGRKIQLMYTPSAMEREGEKKREVSVLPGKEKKKASWGGTEHFQ